MPDGEPQGLVFLFSDEPGPTAEFASAAEKLAGLDLMVAPVALRPFLDRQDAQGEGDKCLYLVSDIEEASRRVQAAGARGRYLTPIIAGTGMGAAVAYAALAQAPDATVAGAASDGFTGFDVRLPRAGAVVIARLGVDPLVESVVDAAESVVRAAVHRPRDGASGQLGAADLSRGRLVRAGMPAGEAATGNPISTSTTSGPNR